MELGDDVADLLCGALFFGSLLVGIGDFLSLFAVCDLGAAVAPFAVQVNEAGMPVGGAGAFEKEGHSVVLIVVQSRNV